jgi:parallel beta-helix repeat protein
MRLKRPIAGTVLLTVLIGFGPVGCMNAPLSKPSPPAPPSPTAPPPAPIPPTPPPAPPPPTGQTFYIAPSGNDTNPGNEAKPWQTLQHAADTLKPGETVLVKSGTYTGGCLRIKTSGLPDQPITFKAYPGQTPRLETDNNYGCYAVLVVASYIEFNGFEVAFTYNTGDPKGWMGNGIGVSGYEAPEKLAHHVRIVNNKVHDFPGGGIETIWADYITFEGNVSYGNAFWSTYQNSAMSLYQNVNFDQASGVHNVIRGNIAYRNENKVPNTANPSTITDGNCIIVDDSRKTQNWTNQPNQPHQSEPYTGLTLIENNVCFDNGGRGVHVYSSDNVLARNNTLFKNERTPNIDNGELTAIDASDVHFVNNIVYARSDKPANGTFNATNIVFERNLYFNTTNIPNKADNDLSVADPQFVQPSTDPALANFRLKSSSPALDAALTSQMPALDLEGHTRPQGSGPDLGAYELPK